MITKIKNFLKQSVEWVIGSKPNLSLNEFRSVQIKITALYLVTVVLVLLVLGSTVDNIIYGSLEKELEPLIDNRDTFVSLLNDITDNINRSIFEVRIAAALILILISIVVIRAVLQPVNNTLQAQKIFMRNISHEFRTPLSIIKSNSEATMMDAGKITAEEAIKTISDNLKEVDRITNTLRTLQVLSKYQNRLDEMVLEEMNIYPSVQKAVKTLYPIAEGENLKLTISGEKNSTILGNPPAIEEMLMNLVKNAITYTPKGEININIKNEDKHILVEVSDTGIGIPTQDLPNIFEPMFRGHSGDLIKERRGGGLGLAIVREIARVHNAQIDVQSEVNKGTIFYIRFKRV